MDVVQNVDKAFFPLDDELELLPGKLTPHAHESLVRFGTTMPFAKAAQQLAFTLKVEVSEPTSRRYVEEAGQAYEAWQTQEVERLEKAFSPLKKNEQTLFFSADGAMVPLVGGEWTEVKTLTIGEVEKPVWECGEWAVHSKNHSYFSRMAEASLFQRLALVETNRCGIENAKKVVAVTDGAEWEQTLIDFHCPQAIRVLDFAHAAERVSEIGQAMWGEGSEQTAHWLQDQLHQLKHQGPSALLATIAELRNQKPNLEVLQKDQAYLEKRIPHMQYPQYQAQHLPIGSGAMESGNKVVVEARLKGAGMHWARPHVNPMVALRDIECSNRWGEAWQQLSNALRQQECQRRKELHRKHVQAQAAHFLAHAAEDALHTLSAPISTPVPPSAPKEDRSPSSISGLPAPHHPWRRSPIGKAKFWPVDHFSKN
jgi:Uncharacterised protein family (UPF0236)